VVYPKYDLLYSSFRVIYTHGKGNNLHTESEEHKMKNAEARWPKTTTMEHLDELRFGTSGAILRYGEQILVVGMECWGFHAAVYENGEGGLRRGTGGARRRRQASRTSNAA